MASEEVQAKIGCEEKMTDQNGYEGKFNTLRIISLKAINEFETLQKKCEENYVKYLEERENYIRTKKELDILKEVSSEALGEYENLHRKFTIEQDCRDKAEEFAKQAVRENKQLKRQSTMLINTLTSKVVDIDLEELANAADNPETTSTEDHAFCNRQIENLKDQVESLKIKVDELSEKLSHTEEKLLIEQNSHKKTKEDLINNNANFKQLNRVSLLALDEYEYLQQKLEMEKQNRVQAEKLAAEENTEEPVENATDEVFTVSRDHEAIVKQNEVISREFSKDEILLKALEEIKTLTTQLFDQKQEFNDKVKELEEELSSSNDVQKLQNLEARIQTFSQGMTQLESSLLKAETRAREAEAKVKTLEQQIQAQANAAIPAPPPLPPPPPPPPPPGMLLKKFVGIMSGGKKKDKKHLAQKEDPRQVAMAEMMKRIKTGQITLRKTETTLEKQENEGEAMQNLRGFLKTHNRSPSQERVCEKEDGGDKSINFGVQLRKAEHRKPRSLSDVENMNPQFPKMTLRKPRSRSVGDSLDDDRNDITHTEMDQDLRKLLEKRKASSERETTSNAEALEQRKSDEFTAAKILPVPLEDEQHIKDVDSENGNVEETEERSSEETKETNEQENELQVQQEMEQ